MAADRLRLLLALPRALIADGALGTELQARGLRGGESPEEWNESHPEAVLAVHRGYAEAGSDILLTNSFGANPVRLSRAGLQSKSAALSKRAAELCRCAAEERVVLGSMGPTGALLEPWGNLSAREAQDAFSLQGEALATGGVDGIVLETFFDLRELELAVDAVLESTDLPVGVCMSFHSSGHTIMGASVEAFAGRMRSKASERLLFLGANCSLGPEGMSSVCAALRRATSASVWVKPNAGKPRVMGETTVYPAEPHQFALAARNWVALGAKVVGGCCGTTPSHISRIVEVLTET